MQFGLNKLSIKTMRYYVAVKMSGETMYWNTNKKEKSPKFNIRWKSKIQNSRQSVWLLHKNRWEQYICMYLLRYKNKAQEEYMKD